MTIDPSDLKRRIDAVYEYAREQLGDVGGRLGITISLHAAPLSIVDAVTSLGGKSTVNTEPRADGSIRRRWLSVTLEPPSWCAGGSHTSVYRDLPSQDGSSDHDDQEEKEIRF